MDAEIVHGLGTTDVMVSVYLDGSVFDVAFRCGIEHKSINTVLIHFPEDINRCRVIVTDGVNHHLQYVRSFTEVGTNKETLMRYAYVHLNDEWIIVVQSNDELDYQVWNSIPNLNSFVSLVEAQKYRDMFLK